MGYLVKMNEMQFLLKKIFESYNLPVQDLYSNVLSFISKKEYKKLIMLKEYKKYVNEKNIRLTIGNLHKDLYFYFLNKVEKEIKSIKPDVVTRYQKKNNIISTSNKKLNDLNELLNDYKCKISRINYIIFRNPALYAIRFIC